MLDFPEKHKWRIRLACVNEIVRENDGVDERKSAEWLKAAKSLLMTADSILA